jgi:hypothetical protein
MIEPTNGRVVWFHPAANDIPLADQYRGQPFAAIVCDVHTSYLINVMVVAKDGYPHPRRDVVLKQGDGEGQEFIGAYCEWMPYQKAVAKGERPPALHALYR